MPESTSIILFDGVCNLCNGFVAFLLPRDKQGRFQFGSLQSTVAAELLRGKSLDPSALSTVVLIEGGEIFTESTAVLKILKKLGGVWGAAYMLIVIPTAIRDAVYRFVSRHRYRLFGKRDQCMIPRPEWSNRFIP